MYTTFRPLLFALALLVVAEDFHYLWGGGCIAVIEQKAEEEKSDETEDGKKKEEEKKEESKEKESKMVSHPDALWCRGSKFSTSKFRDALSHISGFILELESPPPEV